MHDPYHPPEGRALMNGPPRAAQRLFELGTCGSISERSGAGPATRAAALAARGGGGGRGGPGGGRGGGGPPPGGGEPAGPRAPGGAA
ncbi:hypothetical protein GSH05_10570, partial [Burkholderia pseudomallei]|uniref:hypothetical protein n=1 Tax=Burkholderia pseudomallei TaxID=28450 RepID=UPI0019402FCD